jgi:hypothetical protein
MKLLEKNEVKAKFAKSKTIKAQRENRTTTPYMPPVVESVFCYCRAHYRVFVGVEDYQARFAEKEAQEMGAVFVDASGLRYNVKYNQC